MPGAAALWLVGGIAVAAVTAARAADAVDQWSWPVIRKLPCEQTVARVNEGLASDRVEALRLSGLLFERGHCVARDPKRAAAFFFRAAERGNAPSMRRVALYFALGSGVQQDYGIAGAWLRDRPPSADHRITDDDYGTGYGFALTRFVGDVLDEGASALWQGGNEVTLRFSLRDPVATVELESSKVGTFGRMTSGQLAQAREEMASILADAVAKLPAPDRSRLRTEPVSVKINRLAERDAPARADRDLP